jgi:uncharacterized repeat protein (TIGR03803 family)
MRGKGLVVGLRILAFIAVTLLVTSSWGATKWHEKVLHNFTSTDGANPQSGLIFDAAGNLYGTTTLGGAYNLGTVFELSPTMRGGWTEKVLHSFNLNSGDGSYPESGLIFDAAGNLYGTTLLGGTNKSGTAFELSPAQGGQWTERVLYSFGNGIDGAYPFYGSLIFDATGSLYGTTSSGGIYNCQGNGGCGTVFKLTPTVGGAWAETVLYNFRNGTDGYGPESGLVLDAAGNLYGTTAFGGTSNCRVGQWSGCGTAFELSPAADGGWTEKVLHNFNGPDGETPLAALIFDTAGNLYGTTEGGGSNTNDGTVFQLSPQAGGGWTESVLYSFSQQGSGGYGPAADTLVFDAMGNLYDTVYGGGANFGGTVFELTPTGGGPWTETVLYSFQYQTGSWAGLIFDADGNLYGTAWYGGTDQCGQQACGTVFELSPVYACIKCGHSVPE